MKMVSLGEFLHDTCCYDYIKEANEVDGIHKLGEKFLNSKVSDLIGITPIFQMIKGYTNERMRRPVGQ
jgi:hypothetical protein